jgi:hypothetical protein
MSHSNANQENLMVALHECQKWKEQVKAGCWLLKIEVLVNF